MLTHNVEYKITYTFPTRILRCVGTENAECLLKERVLAIGFSSEDCCWLKNGGEILLDFGKEHCGGIRILTRRAEAGTKLRLIFGESVSEALSELGTKGSTNDHSPRDIVVSVSNLSDLTFGETGFRFVRIVLSEGSGCLFRSIVAKNILPELKEEGSIDTDDGELNKIVSVAAYTVKLNMQNGFIWDGVKRDRLIWCGDLNPEILVSAEFLGAREAISNALEYLADDSKNSAWINNIPAYSAWWLINYSDSLRFGVEFSDRKKFDDFSVRILAKLDGCIDEEGKMGFEDAELPFFLDWPTYGTPDAAVGMGALILYAAKKIHEINPNGYTEKLERKLKGYLDAPATFKQTKAMQILAGRRNSDDVGFLEKDGAKGLSTFMAYYVLSAYLKIGGKKALSIVKEYFGGMLAKGATAFWEDFDIEWTENSFGIDEIPVAGKRDIHGDFGKYCYKGLRHSLCHGWAGGVLAFIVEGLFGIEIRDGYKTIALNRCDGMLGNFSVKLPTPYGQFFLRKQNGVLTCDAPSRVSIIRDINEKSRIN